jgi:hypothetical protein
MTMTNNNTKLEVSMVHRNVLCIFLLSLFLMAGCSSKLMSPVDMSEDTTKLGENESAIIFFRDSPLGVAIQAPVGEVAESGDVQFIAIISYNTKLLHKTTPGKHLYVVGGESSTLLEADLAPQKYYYVEVNPDMGFWKARFHMEAIPVSDFPKLAKNLKSCKWVTPNDSAKTWFAENKDDMVKKGEHARKQHADEEKKTKYFLTQDQGADALLE